MKTTTIQDIAAMMRQSGLYTEADIQKLVDSPVTAFSRHFWELDSEDFGADRACSGSRTFWFEWALACTKVHGPGAVDRGGQKQDEVAAEFWEAVPRVQEAAARIAALVRHD